jgi:hypothetical protein
VPAASITVGFDTISSITGLIPLLTFVASASACRCVPPERYPALVDHVPVRDDDFVRSHLDATVEQRPFAHLEDCQLRVYALHWRSLSCSVLTSSGSRCAACGTLYERVRKWQTRDSIPLTILAAAAVRGADVSAKATEQRPNELATLLHRLGCAELLASPRHQAAVPASPPLGDDDSGYAHGVPDNELVLLLIAALRCNVLSDETVCVLRDTLKMLLLRAADRQRTMRWSTGTVAVLLRCLKTNGAGALSMLEQLGFAMPTARTILAYEFCLGGETVCGRGRFVWWGGGGGGVVHSLWCIALACVLVSHAAYACRFSLHADIGTLCPCTSPACTARCFLS